MEDYKKLADRTLNDLRRSEKYCLNDYSRMAGNAANLIESLLDKLKYAEGERDAVTRHMIELEQEVGRLREERDAAAQCIRDKCKHIESTEYGCRCDLYDSPCDGCEDGWSRRKEA